MNEIGGMVAGETGKTNALAKPILLQTAQKSWARPVGTFCAGEGGASAEPSDASAEIDNASEMAPTLPEWMWPNVNTNWQASAKIASQATRPPFDLNHLSALGPETDGGPATASIPSTAARRPALRRDDEVPCAIACVP